MSQFPRAVLSTVSVSWPPEASPATITVVRTGTWIDCKPGSALETAYGGPSNLRSLTAGELGDGTCSREALAN